MKEPYQINYAVIGLLFIIGLLGGVIKILYSSGARGLREIVAIIFVAIPVGMIAGYAVFEAGYGVAMISAVAAACSLVADKIVLAIIDSGDHIPELIKRGLTNWVDKKTK